MGLATKRRHDVHAGRTRTDDEADGLDCWTEYGPPRPVFGSEVTVSTADIF